MPWVLRQDGDESNPTLARLYGPGITTGRPYYYRKNASGGRTGLIQILSDGARDESDDGNDGIEKVYYAGFDLPEFATGGARNWKHHRGIITSKPVHKPIIAVNTGTDALTITAHGYASQDAVQVFSRGGDLPAATPVLSESTTYYTQIVDSNNVKLHTNKALTALVNLTGAGTGALYIYKTENLGFNDPEQGAPVFFPDLRWCGSGIDWIEVLLPAEMSDGEAEPSRLKVIMRGKRVRSYTVAADSNTPTPGAFVYSTNNDLVGLDMLINDSKLGLNRVHGRSHISDFIPRCDATLAWPEGGGNGLLAHYYADTTLTSEITSQLVPTVDDSFDGTIAPAPGVPATNFSIKFVGFIKVPIAGTYTFYAVADDGVRVKVNGVTIVDDWLNHPVQEHSGQAVLAANTSVAFQVEYFNGSSIGEVHIDYECLNASIVRQLVPQQVLFSAADAIRQVTRYDAKVVFPDATPVPVAFEGVMQRAPGCDWQDVNAVIKVLTVPNRTPVMDLTYDPDSAVRTNILDFEVARRGADDKPNFYLYTYRNDADQFLRRAKPVPIKREKLMKLVRRAIVAGPTHVGVSNGSLVTRMGETQAALTSDLDGFYTVTTTLEAHKLAKCDFTNLAEKSVAYPASAPTLCMVLEEVYQFSGIFKKRFVLQTITNDFYSDTRQGAVTPLIHSTSVSPFARPPALDSLTLSVEYINTALGDLIIVLKGIAQFHPFNRQRGRLYWKKPGESVYTATDVLLEPDSSGAAAFIMQNVTTGTHFFKVVTETTTGVQSLAEKVSSVDVVIPAFGTPSAFSCFFDSVNQNAVFEVVGTPVPQAPQLELYDLEIRNAADTATLRSFIMQPALSGPLTQGIMFQKTHDPSYCDLTGENGADFYILNFTQTPIIQSINSSSVAAGLYTEFQVPEYGLMAEEFVLYPDDETPASAYALSWNRKVDPGSSFLSGVAKIYPEHPTATIQYIPAPGDRFGILIRYDRVIEYHINYVGQGSVPIYTSGRQVKVGAKYKVQISEAYNTYSEIGTVTGVRRSLWVRRGAELPYNAAMQLVDFGSVPSTIKARVRQRSPFAGGTPSAWLNGVFSR